MDNRLKDKLNIKNVGLFVKNVEVSEYGRNLTLHLLNDPWDHPEEFLFTLVDCEHLDWWITIENFEPAGSESRFGQDVIDLQLGEENYAKEFVIMAITFELVAKYKTLQIGRLDSVFTEAE